MFMATATIIKDNGHLVYQSKSQIGMCYDEHGCLKKNFSSRDIKEVITYDGQDPNDLKKLVNNLKIYINSGFNSQVKVFRVYKKENKPIREITTKQLQNMCNGVFGKQHAPKVPDFTNYYSPKEK